MSKADPSRAPAWSEKRTVTMLARRTLSRALAQPSALGAAPTNARNMATLREIELRLKSVRNIEKITKVHAPLLAKPPGADPLSL